MPARPRADPRSGACGARRDRTSRPPKAASASPATWRSPIAPTSNRASRAGSSGASAAARIATSASCTSSCTPSTGRATSTPKRTLRVDVAATRSPLTSLEFATLRTKDAVCDRLRADRGVRPSIDKRAPDVRVHVHLTDREATVYLDTSGEPLFKRGYRRDADEAPLRENLAAGLLALSRWTPERPLLDPMCGSGTIVTEAALIAADRAPGLARTFGFQKLAWYDGPTWQRIKQAARDRVKPAPATPSIVAQRHRSRQRSARRSSNLRTAQVDAFVARRAGRHPDARRARAARRAARQSAVRRAARRSERTGCVLSAARRCAEAAFQRVDRVLLHRRLATRKTDRPQGRTSARRCGTARSNAGCSRSRSSPARCASAVDDKIGVRRRRYAALNHAAPSVPPLRLRAHALHSRSAREKAAARGGAAYRARDLVGQAARRGPGPAATWTQARSAEGLRLFERDPVTRADRLSASLAVASHHAVDEVARRLRDASTRIRVGAGSRRAPAARGRS